MKVRSKVLVVPIFRRYWLWHSWCEQAAAGPSINQTATNWREGVGLEEKLQILGTQISRKAGTMKKIIVHSLVEPLCPSDGPVPYKERW